LNPMRSFSSRTSSTIYASVMCRKARANRP
jgi:hypothetical protein